MGMVLVPEIRSVANTVKVAVLAVPVRTAEVTVIGPAVDRGGTVSGSESGKVMLAALKVSLARAGGVKLMVRVWVDVAGAAKAAPAVNRLKTRTAVKIFFILILSPK